MLASPESAQDNCLPYLERYSCVPASQEDKCRGNM